MDFRVLAAYPVSDRFAATKRSHNYVYKITTEFLVLLPLLKTFQN